MKNNGKNGFYWDDHDEKQMIMYTKIIIGTLTGKYAILNNNVDQLKYFWNNKQELNIDFDTIINKTSEKSNNSVMIACLRSSDCLKF